MFWTSKIDSFTKRSWFFVAILLTVLATATSASEATSTNNKILVLGDSLSAGLGVDYNQSWPLLLQQQLNQAGYQYIIINAGISGDTTSGGLSRLPKLIDLHQPEILILELGGNDGLRGTPLGAVENNLRKMIGLSNEAGINVLMVGVQLPPNYGVSYTTSFEAIFTNLSEEFGLVLVKGDLADMIKDGLMQPDGIHPNVQGHTIIQQIVWKDLVQLLK
jgi:acyl-CoA thioesterase-1